jgi:hypothetical protein
MEIVSPNGHRKSVIGVSGPFHLFNSAGRYVHTLEDTTDNNGIE